MCGGDVCDNRRDKKKEKSAKIINTTVTVRQGIQNQSDKDVTDPHKITITTNTCLDVVDVDCVSELERTVSVLFVERVCLVDLRIVRQFTVCFHFFEKKIRSD